MMKVIVQHHRYEFKHYNGSLDFPCDFCESNSYDNYHFSKDRDLKLVICKECIEKVLKES